ncbi:MAG: hypothetical protein Q7W56_08010 [Candidatus Latescibacteria bacterium]|nr:hypothetical protein [Candidatus Latescibacterota bacterium]
MTAQISPDTIAGADRCPREHACLRTGAGFLCPAEEIVGDDIVFVSYVPEVSCCYRISFGEGFVCNCPVRREACRRAR